MLYRTLSNHHLAPLGPDTASILDVGTGTGIWLSEMAGLFPQARLLDYMHQYRGVLLTQLSPSTERNQRQRLVQGVQGRLPQECERGGAFATLPLNQEELAARVATPPCSIWLSSSSC